MEIGQPVITTSLQGETMKGRYLAHARTESVSQPNRTDIANGIAPENARTFNATRTFGLILFLHNGRLFQQERNMAFVYPDFRLYRGLPVEGLDVLDGQPIGIDTLVEQAMAQQRAAAGGADGTAVEVTLAVEAPVPSTKQTQAPASA